MRYSTSNNGVVIGNGTIQQTSYEFLLVFYSNYGPILYHFWDKTKYWTKIAIFFMLQMDSRPPLGGPRPSSAITFDTEKLEQ